MEFRNTLNFILSFGIIYLVNSIPVIYSIFVMLSVTLFEILLAEWLMESTRKVFLYKRICPKNKAVLITGCDSGFGNVLARRMDKLGYFVYATCLDPNEEGAKKLSEECTERLTVLSMDVTDDRSIEEVNEYLKRNLKQNVLWAVINNAGIIHYGYVDWTSLEELQEVFNVNTNGALRVIKTFLPFIKKSKGRIINVTSVAGRYTCPGMVGYSMSKSAVIALTTGLRVELAKWGVKCIHIEPHIYSTPISEKETIFRLVDKSWNSAPKDIREEYGEEYIDSYKNIISHSLNILLNRNIYEVIDSLEDAITAEEPLSTYVIGNIIHKFIICILQILPSGLNERMQKYFFNAKWN